jgi:hypothetical protein
LLTSSQPLRAAFLQNHVSRILGDLPGTSLIVQPELEKKVAGEAILRAWCWFGFGAALSGRAIGHCANPQRSNSLAK